MDFKWKNMCSHMTKQMPQRKI